MNLHVKQLDNPSPSEIFAFINDGKGLKPGARILLTGSNARRKTDAASAVARGLGRELHRVDLNKIISKHIGETEKNLSQVLREAAARGVVLFFEEAEDLFGKRSEVRDAHDRFANIEINYLLRQLEKFKGVAVFAIRSKQNVEPAFIRRFHLILAFSPAQTPKRKRVRGGSMKNRHQILIVLSSALFLVSVGIVVNVEARLSKLATQQAATTPAVAVGEKTVEQVQKNIQVLNGLPQSQLLAVMNYMGSSLGEKCTFCHVNKDGKWDFASDAKPEKATAREMIKMVQSVNKANFKGNPAVGCFTCHRGSSSPVRVPQLPIAQPTPFAADTTVAAAPKETPPTAEQILAKYTEALGGTAAIDKIRSRTMKGTWLTSNGITLGYEVYQVAPDRIYTVLNTPKQGVIERGFNGRSAWEKSQRGLRDLEGTELFYLRRYPDLLKDTKLQGQFTRITFGGKDKIDGKDVYVLRGIGVDGKGERLYFDAQTGLLLRRITTTPTMVGLIPEQVDYDDYREVDGVKLPFTIRVTSIDSFYSSTRTFTEIKLNAPVDATKFEKPPAAVPATTKP